jgi:hypothetical protein
MHALVRNLEIWTPIIYIYFAEPRLRVARNLAPRNYACMVELRLQEQRFVIGGKSGVTWMKQMCSNSQDCYGGGKVVKGMPKW